MTVADFGWKFSTPFLQFLHLLYTYKQPSLPFLYTIDNGLDQRIGGLCPAIALHLPVIQPCGLASFCSEAPTHVEPSLGGPGEQDRVRTVHGRDHQYCVLSSFPQNWSRWWTNPQQLFKAINRKAGLTEEEIDKEAVLMRAYGNHTEILIDRESMRYGDSHSFPMPNATSAK